MRQNNVIRQKKNHSSLLTCASLTKRMPFVEVWLFPWNSSSLEINAKGSTNFLMVNEKWGLRVRGGGGGGWARARFPEQWHVMEPSPYVATALSAFGSSSTSAFFEARCKKQGHPTDRFGKLSVRKALNPLQFSKGNFHHELSWYGKIKA